MSVPSGSVGYSNMPPRLQPRGRGDMQMRGGTYRGNLGPTSIAPSTQTANIMMQMPGQPMQIGGLLQQHQVLFPQQHLTLLQTPQAGLRQTMMPHQALHGHQGGLLPLHQMPPAFPPGNFPGTAFGFPPTNQPINLQAPALQVQPPTNQQPSYVPPATNNRTQYQPRTRRPIPIIDPNTRVQVSVDTEPPPVPSSGAHVDSSDSSSGVGGGGGAPHHPAVAEDFKQRVQEAVHEAPSVHPVNPPPLPNAIIRKPVELKAEAPLPTPAQVPLVPPPIKTDTPSGTISKPSFEAPESKQEVIKPTPTEVHPEPPLTAPPSESVEKQEEEVVPPPAVPEQELSPPPSEAKPEPEVGQKPQPLEDVETTVVEKDKSTNEEKDKSTNEEKLPEVETQPEKQAEPPQDDITVRADENPPSVIDEEQPVSQEKQVAPEKPAVAEEGVTNGETESIQPIAVLEPEDQQQPVDMVTEESAPSDTQTESQTDLTETESGSLEPEPELEPETDGKPDGMESGPEPIPTTEPDQDKLEEQQDVKAVEEPVTEPEVTEPEVTEPEVTEPEVTEPEVTEPEVTVPEVTEPEVTEPEVTVPETKDDSQEAEPDAAAPMPSQTPLIPPPSLHHGRTTYPREFLLQFKAMEVCKQPPKELENTECFKPFAFRDQPPMDVFIPFGGGGGGKRDKRREPKKIIVQPQRVEVELHKAHTPWMRPDKLDQPENLSEAEKATQDLYRKFQAILNKLTPQKFQSLAEQALELQIDTEERLRGVIDKIFTKALEEPSFSIAYANLCKVLSPLRVDWETEDGTKKQTNFRRLLLTKCQLEFEKDKKDDEDKEKMFKSIDEAENPEEKKALQDKLTVIETKARRRSLGNIRFIGELFKLKMLSETIMHECIMRLLRSSSDVESLECFARLITTTGKDLDHQQAKPRIDTYFNRMTEIIKKGKIPARIKFMLQDVRELRHSNWVTRSRQEQGLKTIDQIHAEARAEEAMTKHLIAQHQAMGSLRPRDDKRKGGRGDMKPSGERDRDEWNKVEKEKKREKVDTSRITRLVKREKSKEPTLGPASLRPGGWGKPPAATTSSSTQDFAKTDKEKDSIKHSKPSRSSSGPQKREKERERERDKLPSGRGSNPAPKRSHTYPERDRQTAIQAVKDITNQQVTTKPAQKSVSAQPELDEDTIGRKACTIVDELTQNKDFKEATECVKELRSPGMLHVFVRETVNHTLERSAQHRQFTGRLYHELVQGKLLSQEKLEAGLNEVLELAEDFEIDIPRVWDYLGEILAPAVSQSTLPLSCLQNVPPALVESGKAAVLAANVLLQCKTLQSEVDVISLWSDSQLQWTDLGVKDVEEFLRKQKLEFLESGGGSSQPSQEPAYLKDLVTLFGAPDTTNDDIFDWIEQNCPAEVHKTPPFVRTLTSAVVQATMSGSGTSTRYEEERFNKRLIVLKKYVNDTEELQLHVLYALQVAIAKLQHPPGVLNSMFNIVYDLDLVGEEVYTQWKDKGTETFGKGVALQAVKGFFEWLKCAEQESDEEGGGGTEPRTSS